MTEGRVFEAKYNAVNKLPLPDELKYVPATHALHMIAAAIMCSLAAIVYHVACAVWCGNILVKSYSLQERILD